MTLTTPDIRKSLRPLALQNVRITDTFWDSRIRTVREVTLPYQLKQFHEVGHYEALSLKWNRETKPHIFWDSDVAKWLEAASYVLAATPDPALEEKADELIALLGSAQQPDGYLNTYFTIVDPDARFTDLRDAHELYCAGHLIEAGVAHFEATGKRSLLDIVIRYANLISRVFGRGEGQLRGYDGHEEIELALIKLYRVTDEKRFLDLARYFVDERGQQPSFFEEETARRGTPGWFDHEFPDRSENVREYHEYLQAHAPVREQNQAVGHSVRAVYLYSAMTDLAEEDCDQDLRAAGLRLWQHMTSKRMYVTGGIGSSSHNEGFTTDFDLPNFTAYAETCAAIGLVFWAERLARTERNARYLDVLEVALYNGVLAGVNHEGTCFFYDNPLASTGDKHRSTWFGVACCPPNLARLMTSLGSYVYSASDNELAVNLFIQSEVSTSLGGADVTISQHTGYPWSGDVSLRVGIASEVESGRSAEFTLRLRVPGWAEGAEITVNSDVIPAPVVNDGFISITRTFTDGDTIELTFPISGRRIWADPRVASAAGRVAIARGPFVYCAEGADNPYPIDEAVLRQDAPLTDTDGSDVCGAGAVSIVAPIERRTIPEGMLYSTEPPESTPSQMRLIPYFAWDNRLQGEMRVWVRDS